MTKAPTLTAKQAAFCREYMTDLNATQAAIRAGYSKRSAGQQSTENMAKPLIQTEIKRLMAAQAERSGVTREMIVEEYRRIAFMDVRELFTWDEDTLTLVASDQLSEEVAAAVSGVKAHKITVTDKDGNETTRVELELKTHSKLAALNKLGKHLGMDDDTRPVLPAAGNVVVPTQINVYLPDNGRKMVTEVISGNGKVTE